MSSQFFHLRYQKLLALGKTRKEKLDDALQGYNLVLSDENDDHDDWLGYWRRDDNDNDSDASDQKNDVNDIIWIFTLTMIIDD